MPVQPLGPVNMVGQSMTLPAKAQGMFEGGMKMQSQGMDGRKNPGNRIFSISPAVNGKTVWNLDTDGALNLSTQGTWTLTPLTSFNVNVKAWGEGGKQDRAGPFGAGAFAGGTLSAVAGETLLAGVGQDRGAGSTYGPCPGGGWAGLLINSSSAALLIAGAGGGGGYLGIGPATGGAGGYPNGANGGQDGPTDQGGAGATQVGPGAGGVSTAVVSPTNGGNGSGKTGGGGGYGGGGGGGGYFGGGGGAGSDFRGAGGGGGSSYFSPTRISNQLMLSGSGTTPGNASDPARNGAGEQQSGRLIIS